MGGSIVVAPREGWSGPFGHGEPDPSTTHWEESLRSLHTPQDSGEQVVLIVDGERPWSRRRREIRPLPVGAYHVWPRHGARRIAIPTQGHRARRWARRSRLLVLGKGSWWRRSLVVLLRPIGGERLLATRVLVRREPGR